ncbi:MAG: amidase [Pseudomonadota bacterium]
MSPDIAFMSAGELVALYRRKRLSPVEVTRAILDRVPALQRDFNCFCLIDEERAMRLAAESEARWQRGRPCGLVDGVPSTIKDLILSEGWPTIRGSRTISRDGPWTEDAPSVARMRAHGAVFLGKTTVPEFGWKGVTDNLIDGLTRNPWDPTKTPGGSSGGAAVAAALGLGALHLGTDAAGSVRIPAAFSGIYALKPSFGRVPVYPASPMGSLANVGPMTRTVDDAALMLNVIAEPDPRDWQALPYEGRDWRIGLTRGVRGLRIAFSRDLGYAKVDPEVAALVAQAAAAFAALGAHVEETNPGFAEPRAIIETLWMGRFAILFEDFTPAQRALLDPGLAAVAEAGKRYTARDHYLAEQQREALARHMNLFHQRYDLLLTPQMPLPAFDVGHDHPAGSDFKGLGGWTPFTYPFNLTQQPAASVPCGFTKAGLPAAVQIVGPRHRDDLVLQASRAYESLAPFKMPRHVGA